MGRIISVILFLAVFAHVLYGEEPYVYNVTEKAKASIYSKGDVLLCSGGDMAGDMNNKAASLMLEGKWEEASLLLERGLEQEPLFFPFRYNLGLCYIYLNKLDQAMVNFQKCQYLVPEYYKIYLQIGYVYLRKNNENEAIQYYRKSLKLHPRDLNTYVLMGDIHLRRRQLNLAKKYYEKALSQNPKFQNGILGLAKIHFINEEYLKAINLLKSVDLSGDYDKSFHYYYAESAFKMRDYQTAAREYEALLQFKNDRFFLENSILLIKHKLELSLRFTER
ncbi:MAG: tetratricopeptide repeat protein [Spirochaetes bacterium]|nr:tetratricopeptide repeat protein [Spirochaetota bacterium]